MTELELIEVNNDKPNNGSLLAKLAANEAVAASKSLAANESANKPPGTNFGGCKNCKHKMRKYFKNKPYLLTYQL